MTLVIGVGGSDRGNSRGGAFEAAHRAREQLGSAPADLALVFLAGGHLAAAADTLATVRDVLAPAAMAASGASAVLAGGTQLEGETAVAVLAAHLGGGSAEVVEPASDRLGGLHLDEVAVADASAVLVLADRRADASMWQRLPGVVGGLGGTPVLGGCASAHPPGDGKPALFAGGLPARTGLVAVVLRGVEVLPIVATGQVPVGPELVVSAADRHVVHEISGQPAMAALQEALDALTPAERRLLDGGINLGLVHDGQSATWSTRKILSTDADTGAIAVGSAVDPGQTVRLLANSRAEADRALRDGLDLCHEALGGQPPAGSVVFACTSRDANFFGRSGYDAALIAEAFPASPAAGFASQGEVGPIDGAPRALGLTTVVCVFPA
jgi:small ligand-binding sensory domain FIST